MKILKRNTNQIRQRKNESEKNLKNSAFLPLEELYSSMTTSPSGLSVEQVEERQDEYGKNIITSGQNNTVLHRLKEAIVNPFNIVLLVIAIITFFTDVIYAMKPDYLTMFILIFCCLLVMMEISYPMIPISPINGI